MVPCSIRQIVETGRLRQADLLAAAERERRALQVADATALPAAGADRSVGRRPMLQPARLAGARVVAVLGSVLHLHDFRA